MVLFFSIYLEMCDGVVFFFQIVVELQINYIGKGCDWEIYFEKFFQKLCGVFFGIIDFLLFFSVVINWIVGLLVDSSEMIFKFDGRQGVKIFDGIVFKNLIDQFIIIMWMKYGFSFGVRVEKEIIFCNLDKIEMNWYYYVLYVYNCCFVFFLWKDFDQVDIFCFVEFYWKLDQICDKEWYYYVINVEFFVVILYMDGVIYELYLVINDWFIYLFYIVM